MSYGFTYSTTICTPPLIQARGATAAPLQSSCLRAAEARWVPYVIVDHAAAVGAGTRNAQSLHRIEPTFVRREVEAAGFVLDAESTMLANEDDPHSIKVFDPSIKGATDRFAYRFVKPDRSRREGGDRVLPRKSPPGPWPPRGPICSYTSRRFLDIVARPICQDGARNKVKEMIRPWRECGLAGEPAKRRHQGEQVVPSISARAVPSA